MQQLTQSKCESIKSYFLFKNSSLRIQSIRKTRSFKRLLYSFTCTFYDSRQKFKNKQREKIRDVCSIHKDYKITKARPITTKISLCIISESIAVHIFQFYGKVRTKVVICKRLLYKHSF